MTAKVDDIAKHHWLCAAQVIFTDKDKAEEGGVITLNAMLLTEDKHVNAQSLAQAQRTITANMQERFKTPTLGIVDIVFLNISYLGYMTADGFNPNNSVKPV